MKALEGAHAQELCASPGARDTTGNRFAVLETFRLYGRAMGLLHQLPRETASNSGLKTALESWLSNLSSRRTLEETFTDFCRHLWLVQQVLLPRFARQYLPTELIWSLVNVGMLCHDGSATSERELLSADPLPLVERFLRFVRFGALKPSNDDWRAIAAARDLALAFESLRLMRQLRYLDCRSPDWWNPQWSARTLRQRFFRLLRSRGLIQDSRTPVQIFTCHEAMENRCVGVYMSEGSVFVPPPTGYAPGQKPLLTGSEYDLVVVQTAGGAVQALLRTRYKGVIQTIGKTLETDGDDPWKLGDIAGASLAYRSIEELRLAVDAFRAVFHSPYRYRCRLSEDTAPINPYADPGFLVTIHRASEHDDGRDPSRLFEVQHTLATIDVDRQVSWADINTFLYHVRRHTNGQGLFWQLFPLVDWCSPHVQRWIKTHIRESIPL